MLARKIWGGDWTPPATARHARRWCERAIGFQSRRFLSQTSEVDHRLPRSENWFWGPPKIAFGCLALLGIISPNACILCRSRPEWLRAFSSWVLHEIFSKSTPLPNEKLSKSLSETRSTQISHGRSSRGRVGHGFPGFVGQGKLNISYPFYLLRTCSHIVKHNVLRVLARCNQFKFHTVAHPAHRANEKQQRFRILRV